MTRKQIRYEEREARLRKQARVWKNMLLTIANHKMEAYEDHMQPLVSKLCKKVDGIILQADECRANSIWNS